MSRVLNHIFVVVVAAGCIAIGTTIAWSNLAGPATAYASKADFDQAFTDAFAGQRELSPAVREKLRTAGSVLLKSSPAGGVNREHKTDRLPKIGAIVGAEGIDCAARRLRAPGSLLCRSGPGPHHRSLLRLASIVRQ